MDKKRRKQPLPMNGGWFRYGAYEVRENRLGPVAGSAGTYYDPWEDFSDTGLGPGPVAPSYRSLLSLAEDTPSAGPDLERRLVEFANRYGLLGVLLAETDQVILDTVSLEAGGPEKKQKRHFRFADGWHSFTTDQPMLPRGISRQPLGTTKLFQEDLDQTWRTYFPSVHDDDVFTHQYPRPGTEEFWSIYSEPIEDILRAARLFSGAISQIVERNDEASVKNGLASLHTLVFRVTPSLMTEPSGSLKLQWVATSLLGSFAMMALLDLSRARAVLRCENCHAIFVAGSPKAKYCSSRCRDTTNKRRSRARRKP